jgi:hypothetical protein
VPSPPDGRSAWVVRATNPDRPRCNDEGGKPTCGNA